jgi:hypothetical protein
MKKKKASVLLGFFLEALKNYSMPKGVESKHGRMRI